MIDHEISINEDVSKHVISCAVQQSIENDSDPGKITVVLANVDQIYTDRFVPQVDTMVIKLKNFVYSAEREWIVAIGKVTDAVCPVEEMTVKGECDLGHLADYLTKDYNFNNWYCKDILKQVLDDHDPPMGDKLDFEIKKDIKVNPCTFDAGYTIQGVLEDIRIILGAVFYFDWDNRLKFRDPKAITSYEVLDPFMSEPTRARSLMGFCNYVTLRAYSALDAEEEGSQTGDHIPIIATAQDDEDIALRGRIVAPPHDAYNIHTQDEAQDAADKLLGFYQQKKDTLTEIVVDGLIPPLQSLVSYTSFEDPDGSNTPVQLFGVVIERKIEYSIDGLQTTITIHPRTSIADVVEDIADLLGEQSVPSSDPAEEPKQTDTYGNPLSDLLAYLEGLEAGVPISDSTA